MPDLTRVLDALTFAALRVPLSAACLFLDDRAAQACCGHRRSA
jgi:hypothetical protein